MVNIVFMKHLNSNNHFLFQLECNELVKKEERWIVNTTQGNRVAIAVTDNNHVDSETLDFIVKGCGGYYPLKRLLHKAEFKVQERRIYENGEIEIISLDVPF